MSTILLPKMPRETANAKFEIASPVRSLVMIAASLLMLATAIAVFKWLTGLAPDIQRYRNWAVAVHVLTVLPAVPLGACLLLGRKGDGRHRLLGRLWVGLMVTTALAITFVRGGTEFSWIHIFVPYTLLGAWQVVRSARKGNIAEHRRHIIQMYLGALIIPGAFAFLPGRMFGTWLFG